MIENHNNDILFNMELDKEINQFENSNLGPDSRPNSKHGFMHSRQSSLNRHISGGLEMEEDEESYLLAIARSRTRSTAATATGLVNVTDNLYSTP